MNKPDALFLDIDGTILDSRHRMSSRVAKAIEALRVSGTLIFLATGRSWEALKPLYQQMGLKGLAICYNGAMIVDGASERVVFEKKLDEQVGRAVIVEAQRLTMESVGYRNSKLVYAGWGPEVEAYIRRVKIAGENVDFQKLEKLEFTKMILFSDHDRLESVKEDFEKRFSADRMSITYSDLRFLEFMGGNIDKGRGLREVCRIQGIEPERSAAIGDGWNDVALLQSSGDPWVMGDASDDMKALFSSDHITLSVDEDGAALIMEAMLG